MNPDKTKTALKAWMGMRLADGNPTMVLASVLDFDPEKLLAQCDIDDVFRWARGLEVDDACARLAIDRAKVVAHLNPDPRVQASIDAAEKCLNSPTGDYSRAAYQASLQAGHAAYAAHTDAGEVYCAARAAEMAPRVVLAALMRDAADEAEQAFDTAREAAQDHPELIHKLDACEVPFRTAVYNALMGEIERLT